MTTRKREKASDERVRVIKTDYPSPNIYSVPYSCGNCGWSGTKKFEKGKPAPELITCPKCELVAKKSLSYVRRETAPKCPIIPIIPGEIPPWPRELSRPSPMPPYDPWGVPFKPYRPWDEPQRPHFEWRQVTGIENDIDNNRMDWEHS